MSEVEVQPRKKNPVGRPRKYKTIEEAYLANQQNHKTTRENLQDLKKEVYYMRSVLKKIITSIPEDIKEKFKIEYLSTRED